MIDITEFPDRLNLGSWARFFYELWPSWAVPFATLFAGFILTFVLMWVTGLLLEQRWIPYSAQYKGLKYGDLGVGITLTAGTIATVTFLPDATGMWYQGAWLHNIGWGLGFALMLLLKGTEIFFTLARTWAWGRPKNHTMRWAKRKSLNDEGVYTIGQQLSPTSLVHTALIPLVTYLTVVIVSATAWEMPQGVLGGYNGIQSVLACMLLAVMALGLYIWFINSVVKDNKERKNYKEGKKGGRKVNLSLVHPYNGWFPKFQVFLGLLVAGKYNELFVWRSYTHYNSFSHARRVSRKRQVLRPPADPRQQRRDTTQTRVEAPECVVGADDLNGPTKHVRISEGKDGKVTVEDLPFTETVRPSFGKRHVQPAAPPWATDRQSADTDAQPHIVQPQQNPILPPWRTGGETSVPPQGDESSKPVGWVDPPWVKK